MPRRKPGELLPLELEILQTASAMQTDDRRTFHGFGLASAMREDHGRGLVGHGTLYKALARLEEMGLLRSHWEHDPPPGRPQRRLYEITATGVARLGTAVQGDPVPPGRLAAGTA